MIDLNNFKKAYIMVPEFRALDMIYFCDLIFNFDYIDFKFDETKNLSNLILIDQTYINKISLINKNKEYKFIVFIWNGSFDLKKFDKDIQELKSQNIDFKLFIIGSFHNKDRYSLNSSSFKIKKLDRKIIIKNLSQKIKMIYDNNKFYSILGMIRYPLKALNKMLFPKLMFYGFGKIREIEIKNIRQNNLSDNFNKIKKYYWEKLFEYENKGQSIENLLILFRSILNDQNFKKIEIYEQYYILQNFFRHIFIKICSNFKNFEWERFEKKLSVYHSYFYNNNYYIDFGSKCDTGKIYSRYLFLKRYNKQILNINFFKNMNDQSKFEIQILNSIKYLTDIQNLSIENNNLSATKLYNLLKINYDKLN